MYLLDKAFIIAGLLFILYINEQEASDKCQLSEGVLKYEVGKSYSYAYNSSFDGFKQKEGPHYVPLGIKSSLNIEGTVIFTFLSECEVVLTLQDAKIYTIVEKDKDVKSVEIKSSNLKFTFKYGMVKEVFVDPNEDAWTQNIKKGILTIIQNRMLAKKHNKHLGKYELSIYGRCETTYGKKSKDINLMKCGQGESSDIINQGVVYWNGSVENKGIFAFMRTAQTCSCTHKMEKGILTDTSCIEHVNGNIVSGGMKGSLIYKSVGPAVIKKEDLSHLTQNSSILFNFTQNPTPRNQKTVENEIKQLLKLLQSDGDNKANIFIQLKIILKKADNLKQVDVDFLEENNRKTYYDALAEVATDESIHILSTLGNKGVLDKLTQLKYYSSMAFASNPGPKALKSVKLLVENISKKMENQKTDTEEERNEFQSILSLSQHLLLGVSGLAHQFCKISTTPCIKSSEYVELVDEISKYAKANIKEIEIVIAALHALGNLDKLTPAAEKAIKDILDDDKNTDWIVVHALEAFRRDPCNKNLKTIARKILKSSNKTDQVRIYAYNVLSKCIKDEDKKLFKEIIQEKDSKIGFYIASHVKSMSGSSSPSKTSIKHSMSGILIPTNINLTFNSESRNSRHLEYSTFNEKDNIGLSGEALIIFTKGKTQPTFLSFNLTFDYNGRSFNFLEVGLSQRFTPSDRMYRDDSMSADWCCADMAIMAKDSYVRLFGTTISIGLEAIHNTMQMSLMQYATNGLNLTGIYPDSLLDEELTMPSLIGLPITYSLDAVKFDSVGIQFTTGKTPFSELMNQLFAPESDYNLLLKTDSALTAVADINIGANSPIGFGYKYNGKIDYKTNFGLELALPSPGVLDMKIKFPDTVIVSKEISGEGMGYQMFNGKLQSVISTSPALKSEKRMKKCFECPLTGLKSCMNYSPGHMHFVSSLEKYDENMESIEIKFKTAGAENDLTISTPGAKMKRHLIITSNSPKEGTYELKVKGELGEGKREYSAVFETKEPPIGKDKAGILPMDYNIMLKDTKENNELFSANTIQEKEEKIRIHIDIKDVLSGDGNFSMNETNLHLDLDVDCFIYKLGYNYMEDLNMSQDEYKRKSKTIITKSKSIIQTIEEESFFNFPKNSFGIDFSVVNENKIYLKAHLNGNATMDPSGESMDGIIDMFVEESGGKGCTGKVITKNTYKGPLITSDLEIEFKPQNQKPYIYISKVKIDNELKEHSLYDYENRITVDKEFKGVFLAPFDIKITKDINIFQMKDTEIYKLQAKANYSDEGKLIRKNEIVGWMDVENGKLNLTGMTIDDVYQGDMIAHVSYSQPTHEMHITNVTYHLTVTHLQDKNTTDFVKGSVDKSVAIYNPMEFQMIENGYTKIFNDEYEMFQEFTLNNQELRFYEELTEIHPGMNKSTTFMIDIHTKLIQDQQKLKIGMTSITPFESGSGCPMNFNITL